MKGTLHIDDYGPAGNLSEGDLLVLAAQHIFPRPVSYWRQLIVKTGGYMPGFDGERWLISLQPWVDAPEDTMLTVYIDWVDPKLVGTVDPAGPPWGRRR